MKASHWQWLQALLMFLGLLCKGLAISDPLPIPGGAAVKGFAAVIWVAFDGSFFWLLKSPKEVQSNETETTGSQN